MFWIHGIQRMQGLGQCGTLFATLCLLHRNLRQGPGKQGAGKIIWSRQAGYRDGFFFLRLQSYCYISIPSSYLAPGSQLLNQYLHEGPGQGGWYLSAPLPGFMLGPKC